MIDHWVVFDSYLGLATGKVVECSVKAVIFGILAGQTVKFAAMADAFVFSIYNMSEPLHVAMGDALAFSIYYLSEPLREAGDVGKIVLSRSLLLSLCVHLYGPPPIQEWEPEYVVGSYTIVGIERLLDDLKVTAAKVCVTAAKLKLISIIERDRYHCGLEFVLDFVEVICSLLVTGIALVIEAVSCYCVSELNGAKIERSG
ncbi:hypothetical protein Tco_0896105 [Tanacetum coccineum]